VAERIPARLYQCEYGLFRQEILTEGSELDHFTPNIVFMANDSRDISRRPELDDDMKRPEGLVTVRATVCVLVRPDTRDVFNDRSSSARGGARLSRLSFAMKTMLG